MADIRSKLYEIYSLEQLSSGSSGIHTLHPLVKMVSALVYIACVVSFGRYALGRLVPYVFYPVILMAAAGIPYGMILKRSLVALPFCLFAGLSNLFFDRAVMARIGSLAISCGMVSLLAIVLRAFLSVSAVLILVAVTPFAQITGQLRRLHVPNMIVNLFEMTYRYCGTLLGEAASMFTAYQLRGIHKKGLAIKHMGSFVGQLLIRSFDRAERVYSAMKCRGYPGWEQGLPPGRFKTADACFLALTCGSSLLFRFADVQGIFTKWLEGLL